MSHAYQPPSDCDCNGCRFKLVLKGGQPCTGLACCISRSNEILVALSDYSIKVVDVGEINKVL